MTQSEGDAGTTNFVFTVTKTGATNLNASVTYTTADNTAKVSDSDYLSNTNTLTFAPVTLRCRSRCWSPVIRSSSRMKLSSSICRADD